MSATCVICAREAEHGYLCVGCFERVAEWLHDVENEAAILSAVKSMAIATGNRGAGLASQRSPARLDVVVLTDPRSYPYAPRTNGPACRDCWHGTCMAMRAWENARAAQADGLLSIFGVLGSWARLVREERNLEWPAEVTVTSERRTLSSHLDWVSDQPWVDEFVGDLRTLRTQLKAANGTNEPRKKPVGICPTLLASGECGGRLWPNERLGEVVCESCERNFGPDELRHLGDMLIRQGYVEVFRAEWFTGVPAGTIRRWVAERRCTSEKDGRKLMVQIGEIEELRDRGKRRVNGVAS
jgi:hypothetical protein